MKEILKISGLTGIYKNEIERKPRIDKVNLSLFEGEVLNIEGDNGSGKSTLLKLISKDNEDFEEIKGNIYFYDTNIINFGKSEWNTILGKMYQNTINNLILNLTCFENLLLHERKLFDLRLFSNVYSRKRKCKIENEIKKLEQETKFSFGIEMDKVASKLSGGQKQLLSLLALYFQKPKILLLDEPIASLDDEKREHFKVFLDHWVSMDNLSVIMISHGGNVSFSRNSRFVKLENGRIKSIKNKNEYIQEKNK